MPDKKKKFKENDPKNMNQFPKATKTEQQDLPDEGDDKRGPAQESEEQLEEISESDS